MLFQRTSISISIKFNGLRNFQCVNDVYIFGIVSVFSDTVHVASSLHVSDICCLAEQVNEKNPLIEFILFFPYHFEHLRNMTLNFILNYFIFL